MEAQPEHAEDGVATATPENGLEEVNANGAPVINAVPQQAKAEDDPDGNENPEPNEPEGDGIRYSENIVPADEDENSDQDDSKPLAANIGLEHQQKKKRKKKSKSKRGLAKPTGFEEFYVDAPVTPEVYKEELDLYHASRPFTERIQTAIQRFFAKRNFHSDRKDVFDKYMAYGGIDAGSKMFSGGLDATTISDRSAAELRDMTATHFVSPGQGDEDDPRYVVDFAGCAKGFLSCRLPQVFELGSEEKIKLCTSTIYNFLNYLVHHDVCPEYQDDIQAARAVCLQAEKELWYIARANAMLPGNFNQACSTIYGGIYRDTYIGDQEWACDLDGYKGMSPQLARKTFKIGFTANASDEMYERYKSQSLSRSIGVTSVVDTGLEVTGLVLADRKALKLYDHPEAAGLRALGKMKARTWYHPGDPDDDRTEEEEQAGPVPREVKEYEFWVEDELLQRCFVGMKLETTVRHLSFGLDFFDNIAGVYCSFYRILPNEMMIGWKEPGPRLAARPKVSDGGGVAASDDRADDESDHA